MTFFSASSVSLRYIKKEPNFSQSYPIIKHNSFSIQGNFSKWPRKLPNIWATFTRKFVPNTFLKMAQYGHTARPFFTHSSPVLFSISITHHILIPTCQPANSSLGFRLIIEMEKIKLFLKLML